MRVTAYTEDDFSMNGKGITANGEHVEQGRTIAAPKDIPFGSEIYIPQLDEVLTVDDRGGAIKGDKLDLYMTKRRDALKFGVKWMEIYVVEK